MWRQRGRDHREGLEVRRGMEGAQVDHDGGFDEGHRNRVQRHPPDSPSHAFKLIITMPPLLHLESYSTMMSRNTAIGAAGISVSLVLLVGFVRPTADPLPASLVSGLTWRNLGPFRGGRISAVTGAIGQPGVFYIGLPLGGVWKTTSAGEVWTPVFDAIKEASSVGAVEVAPSDPNVIYLGMGDLITGGGINEGNGVYKSTDGGSTWQHLGLDDTRQIPSILVDPKDPNLVLLAAQGDVHKKSETRGVFRSIDGGKTWTKTLYVDDTTGMQKIAWAPDHPEVILATSVRHYVVPVTGPGGGLAFPPPESRTRPSNASIRRPLALFLRSDFIKCNPEYRAPGLSNSSIPPLGIQASESVKIAIRRCGRPIMDGRSAAAMMKPGNALLMCNSHRCRRSRCRVRRTNLHRCRRLRPSRRWISHTL